MRIFIAGATGAIGVPLVRRLVAGGHTVAGMTRSESKAGALRALGAEPVVCDVFDLSALTAAVTGFGPDAVIHQLTDLPDRAADIPARAAANSRIRREGTRNLLAAARAAGAPRFLAQSVAWELPGDGGAAVREHERAVLDAGGVVLRYGRFYGPGTYHPDDVAEPPAVHVEEAARRTADALEAPSGVITVVSDRVARP
ncbi:MAG TPA: NAD-dependent epimerase/dehydratase family protein [Solirubrobacteraceae bacterium]